MSAGVRAFWPGGLVARAILSPTKTPIAITMIAAITTIVVHIFKGYAINP
jgi:hypothetical protein